jgi:predicted glutamine amidotransferase
MCRIIFALNQPYIKSKIKRFLMQSTSNYPNAIDGYGLAAFNPVNRKWRHYKSNKSPREDTKSKDMVNYFAEYPLVVGHLRNSENINENLSAKCENSHPFYYRNHVFVHNGRFDDANLPANRKWFQENILPEYWEYIRGYTDSECVFYLLLSTIQKRKWIYKDVDMLKNRGCKSPSIIEELRDAVNDCFQLLHRKFHSYFANFIYSDKEYSIVGRLMKNISEKDNQTNCLYFSGNDGRVLFLTVPFDETFTLIDWGRIYIINNMTGKMVNYEVNMDD